MAQNEEQIVVEEELTSYTSESAAPAAAKAARPALTVAGAAVGRRKEAVARVRVVPPGYRSCTERDRPREQPPRTEEGWLPDP